MALQKKVGLMPDVGFPGQHVHFNQAVYTPFNYISDGTVKAGSFCFAKDSSLVNEKGVKYPVASLTGSGAVLGFVERVLSAPLAMGVEASDVYVSGQELTIAIRGDYYFAANGAATVGQHVLVNPADGVVSFGKAGAENDTGWVVQTEAKSEGDIIIISNHGVSVGGASAGAAAAKVNLASGVEGVLPITNGGTGASDKENALTNLGAQKATE